VFIRNKKVGSGQGNSKKEAQLNAARDALYFLKLQEKLKI
jgi:dsRNA-specific ribonuclease